LAEGTAVLITNGAAKSAKKGTAVAENIFQSEVVDIAARRVYILVTFSREQNKVVASSRARTVYDLKNLNCR